MHAYMNHYLMVEPRPEVGDKGKIRTENYYHYDLLLKYKDRVQDMAEHYVIVNKRRKIRAASIGNYINAIQHFYKRHVKGIDWEQVRSFCGEHVKAVSDREYYDDEVNKMLAKTNERGRVVIRTERQTGIRRGGIPPLEIEDLLPRETKYGKIYKVVVYKHTPSEYFTFGPPEWAAEVDSYFEFRMQCGELCPQIEVAHVHHYVDGTERRFAAGERHLDFKAPVVREEFDRKDPDAVKRPRHISEETIDHIVREAAIAAGLRPRNKGKERRIRHRVMLTHGLRKAFKKSCRRAKVDPILLEYLMGHKSGNPKEGITKLMMTYDPEDEAEAYTEFEKAIESLSLSESYQLKKEIVEKNEQLAKTAPLDVVNNLSLQLRVSLEKQDALLEYVKAKNEEQRSRALRKLDEINKANQDRQA